jgi:spore germination protein YaaH
MASNTTKIDKLSQVRTVRRKSAEQRNLLARNAQRAAEHQQEQCRIDFDETVDGAQVTRRKRMEAIFAAANSHGLHQANAVAAYELTQQEINDAREAWRTARDYADLARMRANLAQRELARAMQIEEKVKHLSRILYQREKEVESRQE